MVLDFFVLYFISANSKENSIKGLLSSNYNCIDCVIICPGNDER